MAYKFFGSKFNTMVMTASTSFDGTTSVPTTPATMVADVTTFTAASIGLMDLHERALEIAQIGFKGTGTLSVSIKIDAVTTLVGTVAADGVLLVPPNNRLVLPAGAKLVLSGASAGSVTLVAKELDWA